MRGRLNSQNPRASSALIHLATLVLVVVALKFGKPVLVPLALATLFTFLLNPIVTSLCRSGLRLSFSIALVVILGFSILGATIWGFGSQMTALAAELPDYRQNIREKILDLRSAGSGSTFQRLQHSWREIRGEIDGTNRKAGPTNQMPEAVVTNTPAEPDPVPVIVHTEAGQTLATIPTALGPLAEVAATAALVVVLVIFMLLRGRELRNRIIVFFGHNRIPTTTRALDEAAERISRYLLMQTIINSSYGFAVGVAFYFIGLPYALMWGFLAALLRFIPYVGPWLGAIMPILLSLAVFPGWLHPLIVLGVILVFELISNMLMEPLLYGPTVGVSEVALIVAVAFWTWIWGPIGLALATPLTVCLVVLGKHVPGLSFVPLLMGDEPAMSAPVQFYQRLLAMDDLETAQIAEDYLKEHELIEFYDDLLLPALVSARRDYKNGDLSDEHLEFIAETAAKLINKPPSAESASPNPSAVTILGIPVEDNIDELILQMLRQVLPETVQLRTVSSQALTGELIDEIEQNPPAAVCIGAALYGGISEMRYLGKRLKAKYPSMPLLLARWGLIHPKRRQELGGRTGVADVAGTLKESRTYLIHFAQLTPTPAPKPAPLEPLLRN